MDRGVPRIGRSGCDRMDEFAPELVRGVVVRPHDVSVSVDADPIERPLLDRGAGARGWRDGVRGRRGMQG